MVCSYNLMHLQCSGEYLFDPKKGSDGSESSRDRDHLACITELLERLPEDLVRRGAYGREYYHSNGEIRGFPDHKLRPWSLKAVLEEKYGWHEEQAEQFFSWLLPMFELRPEDRATAAASAEHSFLTEIQVEEELGESGSAASDESNREEDEEEITSKKFTDIINEDGKTKKFKENIRKDKKLEMKQLAEKVVSLQDQSSRQKIMIEKLEAVKNGQTVEMDVMNKQIEHQKIMITEIDKDR